MRSRWNEAEASQFDGLLAQRIYSSRLLGAEPMLVLHGGGNTSVKVVEHDVHGSPREILYVKGSGGDLATITEGGYTPLLLDPVRNLGALQHLADPDMVRELAASCIRPGAPSASIEAILHAVIPHRFVDHTHADAVLAVTNTDGGDERVREIYGDDVLVIPYVMPGFVLARACAEAMAKATGREIGIVLLNHGIFAFGDTARESYERMIALVTRAEEYLANSDAWDVTPGEVPPPAIEVRLTIAALRRDISAAAGRPMIVRMHENSRARAFAQLGDAASLAQEGPATPDHVIRTKRLPLLGRDVGAYAERYRAAFARLAPADGSLTMLDPAPRVVLDQELGLCTVGGTARDAQIVGDIYAHTIDVILRATALGGYRALPEEELFKIEYWDLEQAKLRRGGAPPVFAGEVALVTGAASGIGKACVASLMARGAAVVGIDINPAVTDIHTSADYLGITCDVTDTDALERAVEAAVRRFGGIDIVVASAGIFPSSKRIAELSAEEFERAMRINTESVMTLLRLCHPMLAMAPRRGRVAIVASRNVPAPGPGAAAYSVSKAALTQLARVAALEWGKEGIRVNVVHPHAVFDTGIWTDEVLASRAAQYGMTIEQYKSNNILKVEITSRDVAELAAEMCGPLFAKVTGAQVPIDGGNERVI